MSCRPHSGPEHARLRRPSQARLADDPVHLFGWLPARPGCSQAWRGAVPARPACSGSGCPAVAQQAASAGLRSAVTRQAGIGPCRPRTAAMASSPLARPRGGSRRGSRRARCRCRRAAPAPRRAGHVEHADAPALEQRRHREPHRLVVLDDQRDQARSAARRRLARDRLVARAARRRRRPAAPSRGSRCRARARRRAPAGARAARRRARRW